MVDAELRPEVVSQDGQLGFVCTVTLDNFVADSGGGQSLARFPYRTTVDQVLKRVHGNQKSGAHA